MGKFGLNCPQRFLCSLRAQLPFGLYDADHVAPPVVLRRGEPGENYEGIRKGPVNVEGRPVLADARGPFGNPSWTRRP